MPWGLNFLGLLMKAFGFGKFLTFAYENVLGLDKFLGFATIR